MRRVFTEGDLRVALNNHGFRLHRLDDTAHSVSLSLSEARDARDLLDTAISHACKADPMCSVCNETIPLERVQLAHLRGQNAKYCSDRCRSTAAKRRQRAV
jgi:hypothetical protein